MNKILDVVGNSELEVNVKTPDARHLLATGLLLVALIVGGSAEDADEI